MNTQEIYKGISLDIPEIKSKLDGTITNTRKIDNSKSKKFTENFVLHRNTYGTFENASNFSIITNDYDRRVQVLGIWNGNDSVLATYDNRDSVGFYGSITSGQNVSINVSVNCIYTINTVEIPRSILLNEDNCTKGMIIDTKHSPKYSAIIDTVNYDTNTITVLNWYQKGNTSKGQIPTSDKGLIINPITKIWNMNTNLNIKENDSLTSGTVWEIDILNEQLGNHVDGIDIVNMRKGRVKRGLVVRSTSESGSFDYALEASNCEYIVAGNSPYIGVQINNPRMYGTLMNNADYAYVSKGAWTGEALTGINASDGIKTFAIKNNGRQTMLGTDRQTVTTNGSTINFESANGFVWFVQVPTVTIKDPIGLSSGKMVFLNFTTNCAVTYKKAGVGTITENFNSGETLCLFNDGSSYFRFKMV